MNKKIYIVATVIVTLLLLIFLYQKFFSQNKLDRSSELTQHYNTLLSKHKLTDSQIKNGAIIFIGDSIIEDLNVKEISKQAVNYGIRMDTTYGVMQRIPVYKSLNRAQIIVVSIGVNDLWRGRSNKEILADIETIMLQFPPQSKLILNGIFPVNENADSNWSGWNKRILKINEALKIYAKKNNILFNSISNLLVDDNGQLANKFHQGDGVHLSPNAYLLWSNSLKNAINSL